MRSEDVRQMRRQERKGRQEREEDAAWDSLGALGVLCALGARFLLDRTRSSHTRSGIWSAAAFASMILAMTCAAGCQSPRAGPPLAAELAGSDEDAQVEF